jgi:hypothetical protein
MDSLGILAIHTGTTEEFFTNLNSASNKVTLHIMNLIVQDREDLRERQDHRYLILNHLLFRQSVKN